jgi:hypothetical protein
MEAALSNGCAEHPLCCFVYRNCCDAGKYGHLPCAEFRKNHGTQMSLAIDARVSEV